MSIKFLYFGQWAIILFAIFIPQSYYKKVKCGKI